MNEHKVQLVMDLLSTRMEGFPEKVISYKEEYPYDTDSLLIEGSYYFFTGQFEKAEKTLLNSLKLYPYDVDVYFMIANVYFNMGSYCKCMEYATKSQMYASYFESEYLFYTGEQCSNIIELASGKIQELIKSDISIEEKMYYKDVLARLNAKFDDGFFMFEDMIRNDKTYVGKYFYWDNDADRFAGYYSTTDGYYYENADKKSTIDVKTEFLKVAAEGNNYICKADCPTLVPILLKEPKTVVAMQDNSHGCYYLTQDVANHFDYCRISEDTAITSDKPVIIGEPVKLKMDENKKKLVISLFVDGLAQTVLREEGMENVMPNTHKFFSKGLICNNFFTNSDWTYPSLASYSTGLSIMGHKMFNPDMNQPLPEDTVTLFEHMKKGGYYTAMINGDWRSSGTYGYYRGLDRSIAKHQWYGMRTEQAICDAIEHIETFKETNQYLWIGTGDLHDIADEIGLVTSVSADIDAYNRKYEDKSATSVKQRYSEQKRTAYVKAAKAVDRWLGMLYSYLEENYRDDEYVVTIFGDHGQTYLTKPGEHHLSRSHTNVGFMVRGGDLRGVSDEYMSSVDYTSIMCKLAGIKQPEDYIEGSLPKTFGGEAQKEYVLTETIHPGDSYMAAIRSKDYTCYLTTENKVTKHFKLDMGEYKALLYDKDGNESDDEQIKSQYTDIALQHIRHLFNY